MARRTLAKSVAVAGLFLGMFALAAWDGLAMAGKKDDVDKYATELKTSKEAKVKVNALEELAKIGQIQKPLIKGVIPDMMKALEDKEATVRGAAAKAVGMIDPDPKEVLPLLVKMMAEDKEEAARLGAIQGLAQMGPTAKDATKDLRKLVAAEEKTSKLGKAAQTALRAINKK